MDFGDTYEKNHFLLIFTLILSACQTPKSRENYLSITVTSYNDGVTPESGMTTTVYCLDLKSNEIENKWSFERSAQYPLAVYSRYDNSVYYTQRVEDYKNGNEFLFCADDRLYFIRVDEFNEEENPRGIYSYNLSTKNQIILLYIFIFGWYSINC